MQPAGINTGVSCTILIRMIHYQVWQYLAYACASIFVAGFLPLGDGFDLLRHELESISAVPLQQGAEAPEYRRLIVIAVDCVEYSNQDWQHLAVWDEVVIRPGEGRLQY
jgi:hypothetical protein